jgi:hypothetical protein
MGLVLTLSGGWALPQGTSAAQTSQAETLRKRVGEYYSLVQLGRYTQAEDYMTPESKETFRKIAKSPFLSFEINSVKLDASGQAAAVEVRIRAFLGQVSTNPVPMSYNTNWRLVDGLWYLVLPKDVPTSPLAAIANRNSSTHNPKPGELKFKGQHFNLGHMDQAQKKVARFPFTNEADHVVTITDVITGTPLLTVENYKKEYKHGESGELAIEFAPVGLDSEYAQTVVVKTNPGGLITYLTIIAYVIPPPREPPKSTGTNSATPKAQGMPKNKGKTRPIATSPAH